MLLLLVLLAGEAHTAPALPASTTPALPASAAPAPAIGDRPGPLPRDEVIVWQRTAKPPGAGSQIWAMNGQGMLQREISWTPPGALDTAPSMSQSFGVVVWQRSQGGRSQIVVGDIIDSIPRVVTDFPQGASDPSVARTLQVAFTVGAGADCEIWLMRSDGTRQRRLTDHGGRPGCDSAPVWSPNWRQVAFRRTLTDVQGRPISSREMVIDASGGRPHPLPIGPDEAEALSWAPGDQLLILTGGRSPALIAVDPQNGHRRTILRDPRLTGTPAWAPLGINVAFGERRPDGGTDLFSVTSQGTHLLRLTRASGFSGDHPSWGYPVDQGAEPGPGVHARSVAIGRRRSRR